MISQVERLARELHDVDVRLGAELSGQRTDPRLWRSFLHLARHVLRRERAARGRTLGYVAVSATGRSVVEPIVKDKPWRSAVIGSCCARVVAVPKRKKGAKR